MTLATGQVIRVWDRQTRPPKFKRLICICAESRMFLRINSRPLFPPHLLLRGDGAAFLEHDSYVELQQMVRPFASEIAAAELLGVITRTHARALVIAAGVSPALTGEQKTLIEQRLRQRFPDL